MRANSTLFWRFFLAIWAGYVLLIGVATVLIDIRYEETYSKIEVSERYGFVADYIIAQYEAGENVSPRIFRQRGAPESSPREDLLAIQDLESKIVIFGDSNWTERESSVRWLIDSPNGGRYIANVSIPELMTPLPDLMTPLSMAATLVTTLVFSWLFTLLLTRPISRLQTHVQYLGRGDLDHKLEARLMRRRDEIGDLAKAIDEMSERIQALLNSKQRLLYDVSHELRAPLARLQMAAGIVRAEAERENKDLSLHDRFEQEIEQLNRLISELLLLARTENSEADDEDLCLQDELSRVVEDMLFGAKDRAIETRFPERPVIAHLPSGMLERLTKNLIENALKYSSDEVVVSLVPDKSDWLILVEDSGAGIPEEQLETMLQPFTRLQSESVEGFGLGLSIALRAAENLNGELHLSNRPEGGLRATIRLPAISIVRQVGDI